MRYFFNSTYILEIESNGGDGLRACGMRKRNYMNISL